MASSAVHRVASKVTNDDWKMCSQWILELKVLSPDHPLFRCAQLAEFANMLRDGVILCAVLNRIVPGVIPKQKVTTLAKSMHFSLSNINLVRQVLIDQLDFKAEDVFAERDLANLENFYKVLLTLSQMSRLSQSVVLGAKLWPSADRHLDDDEQIYGRLDEMPLIPSSDSSSSLALPPRKPVSSSIPLSMNVSNKAHGSDVADGAAGDDDDVYQNLAFQYDNEEESVYDKVVSQRTVKPQATTKREYAIKELISTEETYVETLKLIVTELMQPSRVFMAAEPWLQLFQYIDQLYSLHKAFLEELRVQVESALQPNNKNKLNLLGIWHRRKREFLVYTKYVVNKPIAESAYDRIMKGDDRIRQLFNEYCIRVQKALSSRSFSLRDYLFVPIQRVLKYHLLLEAIAKNSPDEDEKKNMRDSLVAISDIQRCINEAQRDGEMMDRIKIIQSAIADMTLPPDTELNDYGRMHIDGEMLVHSHADGRSSIRFVFLFDFMLIICKIQPRQPQQYKLRDCCYVTNLDVNDLDPTAAFRPKDRFKHPFEIRKRSGPNPEDPVENVYTMAVRTESERRNWMAALTTARNNLRPQGYMDGEHHFVYKTFSEPFECCVCGKFMAGSLFQGYECAVEYCQMSCHMKCLTNAPPQPDRRPEPVTAIRAYDGISPEHPRRLKTLRFAAKDIISLWVRWGPDWAYGECRDGKGFFPISYVCEKRPFPAQSFLMNGPQDLSQLSWFVGEMTKEVAGQLLKGMRSGTFLVRKSGPMSQRPGEFAISLKFDAREVNPDHPHDSLEHIRHIRIVKMDSRFSLSQDPPFFPTLPDLISYYQQKSLQPVFNELPTALLIPYQGADSRNPLFEARVLFDFQPSTPSELKLIANENVDVLSTNVQGRAAGEWWRGRNRNGNVGIFPSSFVRRV